MKRFIAIFMTLCLVLGMSSVSVWAADENEWKEETPMPINQLHIGTCVVEDKIFVVGPGNTSVAIYNTNSQIWETGTPMPVATGGFPQAVTIKNKIYVLSLESRGAIMHIYDISADKWTVKKDNPYFYHMAITSIGENIYVYSRQADGARTMRIYNIETDKWTSSNSQPLVQRDGAALCAVGTNIYLLGGTDIRQTDRYHNSLEIYDTITGTWRTASPMPTPRGYLKTAVVGDKIYAISGGNSNKVEVYDIKTDSWSSGVSLKSATSWFGAEAINGKIYVIGGTNDGKSAINTIESLQVSNATNDSTAKLSVLLNEGETVQLSTSYDLDNNKNFTWSSTNQSVATVDSNGKVTALAEGIADIYAQNAEGTFKEYIPVKVVEGIADELRLAVHLKAGEKAKLYLTDDSSQVTWSSMDESVATISAEGQVTGVKKGLAIVKAELDGQAYQIYVRVNG